MLHACEPFTSIVFEEQGAVRRTVFIVLKMLLCVILNQCYQSVDFATHCVDNLGVHLQKHFI